MKVKNYLKLEVFEKNNKSVFGWKASDNSITETLDILLAAEQSDSITYISEDDAFKFIELSTSLKPKQILSSWSFNADLFDQNIRKYSNTDNKEMGKFFISLSNLLINDIPFGYDDKEYYKV